MNETVNKGKLFIFVGPNGYGKTYNLDKIRKQKEKDDKNSTFLVPSEIVFSDEIKDSKEAGISMEIILQELFSGEHFND